MINMDVRNIAERVGGHLVRNGADVIVNGFSTDSRTLQPGDLFIPLRGDNFDGHDYLSQAVQNGAAACLSEETVGGLPVPIIQVQDTLRALGDLASAIRHQFQGPVVGITGTSGKTTTKEMLAAILSQTGRGHKSAGNFNNLIGVPLTLFGLEKEHRWAVVEMGMSARGEIARLAEIANPGIGIITNVGAGHLEQLEGISAVARAKGELFIHLPAQGTAIVNADDPEVVQLPVANGVRRVSFGLTTEALIRAAAIHSHNGTVTFELQTPDETAEISLQLPGRHNVQNALAAAAAAWVLQVPMAAIVAGLERFQPCPGRMELLELDGDIVILEDSYNANPLSMQAALTALHDLNLTGRRIAVLGDMLELGASAVEMHRDIGALAAENVDCLYVYGELAREIAVGAREAGMAEERIVIAESHVQIVAHLQTLLAPGDRVLIKGSRGMRMEQVTAALRSTRGDLTANGS